MRWAMHLASMLGYALGHLRWAMRWAMRSASMLGYALGHPRLALRWAGFYDRLGAFSRKKTL